MTMRAHVVAVVDDDMRVLEALENLLESVGYSVRTYSSGTALLADNRLADVECLISDIGMPVMGGFELARQIRAARPELTILFITGHSETPNQSAAAAYSDARIFKKPFNIRALLLAVGEAIRKHP